MVQATVQYVDPAPIYDEHGTQLRHWSKVEGPFQSFALIRTPRTIENISGREHDFHIDTCGFAVRHWPVPESCFKDDTIIRDHYYPEVTALLKATLPGKVDKVVIFDHTLRQMVKESTRKPVMQVHVDQTARAAEARVRRHMPKNEAEQRLQRRYALINVWRPIGVPALEYPLSMVDWRTTQPQDYVEVDLLYPSKYCEPTHQDDRGIEEIPETETLRLTEGYEVRGETYGIAANERHRFFYVKGMTPESAIAFKCFDSAGPEGGLPVTEGGVEECLIASFCPHTAFVDPETPVNAPSRRSIEVRCLVFWE